MTILFKSNTYVIAGLVPAIHATGLQTGAKACVSERHQA
jgi:hypothetical protein